MFGDFGDLLTAPDAVTVTGFTGQVQVANVVEFATRTYDIDTRVWLQDDAYRGTVARASSLNRYTYVEGAPETYVDKLGFFRAAAALHAQQVAAAKAAYEKLLAEYQAWAQARQSYYNSTVSVPGLQTMPRYVFDSLFESEQELRAHLFTQDLLQQRERQQAAIHAANEYKARKAAEAARPWWKKAADWVSDHKAEIVGAVAGVVVGAVVGAACLAATAGTGSVGCMVLAGAAGGAVGGAVTGGMAYVEDTPADQRSFGGFMANVGTGAAVGAVFGAAGGALGAGIGAGVGALAGRIGATAVGAGVSNGFRSATNWARPAANWVGTRLGNAAQGVDDMLRPVLAEGGTLSGIGNTLRAGSRFIDDGVQAAGNGIRNTWSNIQARYTSSSLTDDTGAIRPGAAPGNLADDAANAGERVVIGKLQALEADDAIGAGERTLLDQLPDQGNEISNWVQNERVLLNEMASGNPIRDASVDSLTGALIDDTGFLYRERTLLSLSGWEYDPATTLWSPRG